MNRPSPAFSHGCPDSCRFHSPPYRLGQTRPSNPLQDRPEQPTGDGDGGRPACLGRRAIIVGQGYAAKSKRLQHARIDQWMV